MFPKKKRNYQGTINDGTIGTKETVHDSTVGMKWQFVGLSKPVVQTMYLHWLKQINSLNYIKPANVVSPRLSKSFFSLIVDLLRTNMYSCFSQ